MKKLKYIILGAGPSGLTLAHSLINKGLPREQILVLEKETIAGGLCRSEEVAGAPLDIGGGHFLDIKKKNVLEFLFKFMPESEWNTHTRVSKIRLRGQEIDHPLESNLWQFSKYDQVDYLESIARAGSALGSAMPESFAEWIVWKFGERIANEYMLPYNRKIWSMNLDELGTYWMYKLPNVSFRETLQSCLEGKPFGALPAHGTFLYPKDFGYGEVWKRMGEALGDSLLTNYQIKCIDLNTRIIDDKWSAEIIINTIPWVSWSEYCELPVIVINEIKKLHNVAIDVDYVNNTLENKSHWIYEPDEKIAYHRLLLRSNFCSGANGYWTEANAVRSKTANSWRHHNAFAYPVNTRDKPYAVSSILQEMAKFNIIGAGRWGKWEHMNSDVAVDEAIALADKIRTLGNK